MSSFLNSSCLIKGVIALQYNPDTPSGTLQV